MKTTDWDTVKATVGVDATARRVASPGVSYECGIAPTDYWDNPLPLRDDEYYELRATTSRNWVDFRGERFGRLTVIGVVAGKNKNGARWLCKCACGGYVTRTSKTLRIAKNGETAVVGRYGGPSFVDRCGRCDVQEKIRTGNLNPETIDRIAKGARKRFAE